MPQYGFTSEAATALVSLPQAGYFGEMPRSTIAILAGLVFMFFYVALVIAVPDVVGRMHWTIEALYWCVAGFVWVFPIRWLMLWSVGKR